MDITLVFIIVFIFISFLLLYKKETFQNFPLKDFPLAQDNSLLHFFTKTSPTKKTLDFPCNTLPSVNNCKAWNHRDEQSYCEAVCDFNLPLSHFNNNVISTPLNFSCSCQQ